MKAPPARQEWPTSPCCGAPVRAGVQRQYLSDLASVTEVLNAGAVGSGKTDAGLMGLVVYPEYRRNPAFRGLVLRHWQRGGQSSKQALQDFMQRVERPGYWPAYVGGRANYHSGVYRFASGGLVQFCNSSSLRTLQGPDFVSVYWDELTHWPTPEEYLYVSFSRVRSAAGLPVRIRAASNPGGPGHAWVEARWGPWLSANYLAKDGRGRDLYPGAASLRALGYKERRDSAGRLLPPLRSGEVLHFLLLEGGGEVWCKPDTPGALTRSCIRSQTADNLRLRAADAGYANRTRALLSLRQGEVLYAQLAQDDWGVVLREGEVFEREWFGAPLDAPPVMRGVVRVWDLAYTAPQSPAQRRDRDWTVGALVGWVGPADDRVWYVLDIIREQRDSKRIRALLQQTAQVDGRGVPIVVPVDYSAGSFVAAELVASLAGYVVVPRRQQGKKSWRIAALASQAQAGRVRILRGEWNGRFLDEAARYPNGWDDQLDAVAEALLWSLEQRGPSEEELEAEVAKWGEVAKELGENWGKDWDWGGGGEEFGGGGLL